MASSSKPKGSTYGVFLSFRGEDVRNNFLGHLYSALVQRGIHTYKDDKELDKGDQISPSLIKAIQDSQIAIIVFSKDYASSSWCLDEAAEIMDCKEERCLKVFPVFFKVEPGEVRTPRQKYKEALVKHESKLGENSERVKVWKKALFNAGNLSGWDFKDGDDESELIQKIVNDIVSHLDRTHLHVAKHPVGMDSQVVRLKSMLNLESGGDGVLMAGLWGQGGIWKTTLAKALYNDIFRQFEASCFLANVRETSKECKDLVTLQTKLLSELLRNRESVVSSVDAGKTLMKERLGNKRILLVLDDVDDRQQLEALAGESEWFGKGSRLIITTRDKHVLTTIGIYEHHVYEVKALDYSEARELFTKYASKQGTVINEKDLVSEVLNYAKGLPLALEVLGSLLCGRRENEWRSELKKLSRIPEGSINDVLKTSYDGLRESEKEIFLNVACFFKGDEIEYVKKVLESCDFEGIDIGLATLIDRSLIKVSFGSTLQMHDLIQFMGMDIVKKECPDDPRSRSRLWKCDDVLDVLSYGDTGNCKAEAIVLEPPELKEIGIHPYDFTQMRRLKLLIFRYTVPSAFQCHVSLPNSLRWFEWWGTSFPVFPSIPKKLVGLDMSRSNIVKVPRLFDEFQQLKYINMSFCATLVSMPDISCTPNLEELDLAHCISLIEAHESIACHDNLQVLNFEGCTKLANFPRALKSKSLRTLNLDWCTKFERFPDIPHKLERLLKVSLVSTAIKGLPPSIGNLYFLEEMNLSNCKRMKSFLSEDEGCNLCEVQFPEKPLWLPFLKNINMSCCATLVSMPDISCTPNLEKLDLTYCTSLVEAHESIACHDNLQVLNLWGCSELANFPRALKSKNLRTLNLDRCTKFERFPDIPHKLEALEELLLEKTAIKGLPASIGNLYFLERMNLSNCKRMKSFLSEDEGCNLCEVQFPEKPLWLPFLKNINMSCCATLVSMPDISCTPNLEKLDLACCTSLVEAHESIACHDNLQVLNLRGCSELTNFPDVLKSKNLRTLDLIGRTKFERFPDIPHKLERLLKVSLVGTAIKGLPPSIQNLTALEEMSLVDCQSLVSLPSSIYKLKNLQKLNLRNCTNLIGLPEHDNSGDPRMGFGPPFSLDLWGCNLSEAQFLENPSCFPSLSNLDLRRNNITSLPSLSQRASLSRLSVGYCNQLQEIPQLPPKLRYLFAHGCESLDMNGFMPSSLHFVHRGFTMGESPRLKISLSRPGVEMPEWIFPVEEGSAISFMASKDLYDKFLALALCFVLSELEDPTVVSRVNGKRLDHRCIVLDGKNDYFDGFDIDEPDFVSLQYLAPHVLWGEVDFSEIDGSCVQFSSRVSSCGRVKKWGIRILCKPLGENLKAVVQENKLMDLGLLYEVRHESMDSEARSSVVVPDDGWSETRTAGEELRKMDLETPDPAVTHLVSAGEANPKRGREDEELDAGLGDQNGDVSKKQKAEEEEQGNSITGN